MKNAATETQMIRSDQRHAESSCIDRDSSPIGLSRRPMLPMPCHRHCLNWMRGNVLRVQAMRNGNRLRAIGVATLLMVAASSQAIVTSSGASPLAPDGLDLAGVGELSNGCSSVLLAGGEWLLGSAHCHARAGA